ncbi:hypothetical protein B9Z55_002856 [Caenorhabditis nigoni]|uniref:CCHC-type domain-containing protein n=1 Tax=Caenorhabditis nigoni TaxID=1611254 RepID=A0A2G5VMF4_9PELO|nr:hypothetical protein B9Z55_002856 [Caenorhabditis nigoni]
MVQEETPMLRATGMNFHQLQSAPMRSSREPVTVPQYGYPQIQLPPMQIPSFNGDILNYYEFRESFDSIMDSLATNDVTRLHYLKTVLSGEPLDLIRTLKTTNNNYRIAISILDDQYGGHLRLKHVLLQKLRELPDITQVTDPSALQQFCTKATLIFNQLISLGCDMNNITTADMIEYKLPKRVIAKIYGNANNDMPLTAHDLLQKIREISKSENLVATIYNKRLEGQQKVTTMAAIHHNNQHHQHQRPQHNAQVTNSQRSRVNYPCALCVEDRMRHYPNDCRKYSTLEERKQRAKDLRLCFRCLKTGHGAKNCTACCYHCKGGHHEAICPRRSNAANGATSKPTAGGSPPFHGSSGPPMRQTHGMNSTNAPNMHHPTNGYTNQTHFVPSGGWNQHHQGRPNQQNQQQRQWTGQNRGQRATTHLVDGTEITEGVTYVSQEADNDNGKLQPAGDDSEEDDDRSQHSTTETVVSEETKDNDMPSKKETTRQPIIMQVIQLPIVDNNGKEFMGNVFFYTGSNVSYISEKFSTKLRLVPKGHKLLKISLLEDHSKKAEKHAKFDVNIKTKKSTETVELFGISQIASNICSTEVSMDIMEKLLHHENIQLQRNNKEEMSSIAMEEATTFTAINQNPGNEELQRQTHQFFRLEGIGITDASILTKAEDEARTFFKNTTTKNAEGRFVCRLPYADKDNIPSNRSLAYHRLMATCKRLDREQLTEKYGGTFKEQLKLNFIEKVPDESKADGTVVSYLSHHPVFKETSKTTKMRIVFDGSAKHRLGDKSLNDHLLTGVNLLPDIAAVLLRIREKPILISADIEKAFLQLELHLEDRDATRFLWKNLETDEIECYRYSRVPFGLKSSPYLLNASIRMLLEEQNHPTADIMARSTFVDNVYMGVNSIQEAEEFYHYSKKIFGSVLMRLCQYVSNDKEVNQYFAQHEGEAEDPLQKLLGIKWDTTTDELILEFPTPKTTLLTKRIVLKWIASCYDPLGFLTPTTLSGKLFLQKLNGNKMPWDAPLSTDQEVNWKKVLKDWSGAEWRIPRHLFPRELWNNKIKLELHIFTDASQAAFGAVAYARLLTTQKGFTRFLMSKSRVAPAKPSHSIPQLEMLGILTGVRLANYIRKHMDLVYDDIYIWTDSMCSLDTLRTNGTHGTKFIRNRVRQIQDDTDLLTRELEFEALKMSKPWNNGPDYLQDTAPLPIHTSSVENSPAITLLNNRIQAKEVPIDPY